MACYFDASYKGIGTSSVIYFLPVFGVTILLDPARPIATTSYHLKFKIATKRNFVQDLYFC